MRAQQSDSRVLSFAVVGSFRGSAVSGLYSVSIRSTDSTVQVDTLSGRDALVGVGVTAFPFEAERLRWLGFMVKVDLRSLKHPTDATNTLGAGVGLAFRLHRRFALGLTVDFVPVRSPRQWVRDLAGEQILGPNGEPLTSFDTSDDNMFVSGTRGELSLSVVFML
jgi:hypothetical protein